MLTQLPVVTTVRQHARWPASLTRPGQAVPRSVPEWAIASAGLSPVLLVAGWLIADLVQPPSYSPIRQTVSVMAGQAGTDRWIVTGALFLVGGCNLLTAVGLAGVRVSARVLLSVAGLASIGIALSPEPVDGSTPQHLVWTAIGAVTIAIWPAFVVRSGAPGPRVLSAPGCAVATVVFVALLCWLTLETQGGGMLGLAERLTSAIQTSWPFIVALSLRRSIRRGTLAVRPALAYQTPVRQPESPDQQLQVLAAGDHDGTAVHLGEPA
jgi:hypothetical membrane protein